VKILRAGLTCLFLGILAWFFYPKRQLPRGPLRSSEHERHSLKSKSVNTNLHGPTLNAPTRTDKLRAAWRDLLNGPHGASDTALLTELARESLDELGLSEDLLDLLEEVWPGLLAVQYFEPALREKLASSSSRGLIDSFIACPDDLRNYKPAFAFIIGKHLSFTDLNYILSSLRAPGNTRLQQHAQDVELGYATGLAATDPVQAVHSAIAVYKKGLRSNRKEQSLTAIMQNVTDSGQFLALEQILANETGLRQDRAFGAGRDELFRRWAKADAKAVFDYLDAAGDTVTSDSVQAAVEQVASSDWRMAFDFVQTLKHTEHFDNAVNAIISRASAADGYLERYEELIGQISDVNIRNEAQRRLEVRKIPLEGM
jgi:hypothetical protein